MFRLIKYIIVITIIVLTAINWNYINTEINYLINGTLINFRAETDQDCVTHTSDEILATFKENNNATPSVLTRIDTGNCYIYSINTHNKTILLDENGIEINNNKE